MQESFISSMFLLFLACEGIGLKAKHNLLKTFILKVQNVNKKTKEKPKF